MTNIGANSHDFPRPFSSDVVRTAESAYELTLALTIDFESGRLYGLCS